MITRRAFTQSALAAPLLAQGQNKVATNASKFNGVQIGVETYCYRELRDRPKGWISLVKNN